MNDDEMTDVIRCRYTIQTARLAPDSNGYTYVAITTRPPVWAQEVVKFASKVAYTPGHEFWIEGPKLKAVNAVSAGRVTRVHSDDR